VKIINSMSIKPTNIEFKKKREENKNSEKSPRFEQKEKRK